MDEKIIFSENHVKITYHHNIKTVKVVWNGTFSKEQYQQAIEAALDFHLKGEFPVDNYLSDILKQGIVNPESRKWFEQVAMPRAVKQGLKRAAIVFDGNVFKKYYINLILQATNAYKLPLKFFSSEQEAIMWFQSFD